MQISLLIPADLLALTGLASPGRAAQHALREALLPPAAPPLAVPDAAARAASVYLPADLQAQLQAHRPVGMDAVAFAAHTLAGWAVAQRQHRAPVPARGVSAPAKWFRAEQKQLLDAALPALLSGNIALAEASTGVGKSRVLAKLADELRRKQHPVTIAVPTIDSMLHVAREFDTLGFPPPRIYLGCKQFVSKALLDDLLLCEDVALPEDERQRISAWDGQPVTPQAQEIARRAGGAAWLMTDLETLAPSIAPDLVAAEDASDAPEAYTTMLAEWNAASVRIATHALIAVQAKHRPAEAEASKDVMLVDEAHLFYDAVLDVCVGQFSYFKLRALIRPYTVATAPQWETVGVARGVRKKLARAAQTLATATDALLADMREHAPGKHVLNTEASGHREGVMADDLRLAAGVMQPAIKALRGVNIHGVDRVLRDAEAVGDLLIRSRPVRVSLSEVRAYPTVRMGHGSLPASLAALWDGVFAALLLSATLYVDTRDGGSSAGYYARQLAVPIMRLRELPRISTAWLYSTPTLHLPAPAAATALCPVPRTEGDAISEAAHARYYDTLAEAVLRATATAIGGTLVLCASYGAVEALATRLEAPLGPRLLVQRRGVGFGRWITVYRDMGAAARPVWLATGPAWTGLDLRDKTQPPETDRLLSDLVVTRIPILPSAESGGSKAYRDYAMRTEAALRFRQGLGRLVRAEGLPDRRLWVLDGRLWSARPWDRALAAPCLRTLARYPKRALFGVE